MKRNKFLVFALMIAFSLSVNAFEIPKPIQWIIDNWAAKDSDYVEPSHYIWSGTASYTMSQNMLDLKTSSGLKVKMESPVYNRLGPGLAYEWIGGNMYFNLGSNKSAGSERTDAGLTIFSQLFNIDIHYLKTGGEFTFSQFEIPYCPTYNGIKYTEIINFLYPDKVADLITTEKFDLNIFYIFNHKKFSYPAAWTNATRQKISTGSAIAGLGYSNYRIDAHMGTIATSIPALGEWFRRWDPTYRLPDFDFTKSRICSTQKYQDFTLWGGYAYNWVPKKNFLVGASGTIGVAVKHQSADNSDLRAEIQDFNDRPTTAIDVNVPDKIDVSSNLVDFNGVFRLSGVWTNDRLFTGLRAKYEFYRYKNSDPPMQALNSAYQFEAFFTVKVFEEKWWKRKKAEKLKAKTK